MVSCLSSAVAAGPDVRSEGAAGARRRCVDAGGSNAVHNGDGHVQGGAGGGHEAPSTEVTDMPVLSDEVTPTRKGGDSAERSVDAIVAELAWGAREGRIKSPQAKRTKREYRRRCREHAREARERVTQRALRREADERDRRHALELAARQAWRQREAARRQRRFDLRRRRDVRGPNQTQLLYSGVTHEDGDLSYYGFSVMVDPDLAYYGTAVYGPDVMWHISHRHWNALIHALVGNTVRSGGTSAFHVRRGQALDKGGGDLLLVVDVMCEARLRRLLT